MAPALFALDIHDTLAMASSVLQADEFLVAFQDDVYIKSTWVRARAALETATHCLRMHA